MRDWIEIVVAGAHMSGLALNSELTSRDGRLVRAARTENCYKLFALPGGPPHRPGLLRVAEGSGTAIDVEVWAMPPAGFGRFVATIPAPLGLATVRLAGGSAAKGFVVESEGTLGARDISSFGGWRQFLAAQS